MSQAGQLAPGTRLTGDPSHETIIVGALLGAGTQGEVYRATIAGAPCALKWYFPHNATAWQRTNLENLVRIGRPTHEFLWPFQIATGGGTNTFGYVMQLLPDGYKSVNALLLRQITPSYRALITATIQLVESFLSLHSQGLCYRDISCDNVCIEEATGNIRILDNDNVDVDKRPGPIAGTPKFMAPEVVRGDAEPSSLTDLFSMSVLLFEMLIFHHPLDGAQEAAIRCLDRPAMVRLYGERPVFVFDPDNESNRPVPTLHDNALAVWPIYPKFLRDTFTRAFTGGIRSPTQRVRGSVWKKVLCRLRDQIHRCQCKAENFYDEEVPARAACWNCGAALSIPPRLHINGLAIMLNHDTELFPHHLDRMRLYDFSAPVAAMARHPREDRLGLRNLGSEAWTVTLASGAVSSVLPGRSLGLAEARRVNFGSAEGQIKL